MQTQSLTFSEIKKMFPELRPSRLDYLVREGLVQCERAGQGRLRFYPPEAIEQIRSYLDRRPAKIATAGEPAYESA